VARLTGSVPENRVIFIHDSLARLLGELKQLQRGAAVTLLAKPRAGHPLRDRHLSVKRGHEVKPKVIQNKSISLKFISSKRSCSSREDAWRNKVSPDFKPRKGRPAPTGLKKAMQTKPSHLLHLPNILNSIYHRHYIQYQLVPELRIWHMGLVRPPGRDNQIF